MRKNWTMRVGVLMLALTLITSCFVGGTFAKYTTSGEGTDDARVAKFGVTITGTSTAFKTEYPIKVEDEAVGALSVKADHKVVAPGTNGTLAAVTITGTPEVAVELAYTADLTLTGWTTNGTDEYCPLIFTVNDVDYKIGDEGIGDVDALIDAVEAAIVGTPQKFKPQTNLAEALKEDTSKQVTWRWAFDETENATYQSNDKDTLLGNRAADDNAATIDINVTATVTQID